MPERSLSAFRAFRTEGYPSYFGELSFKIWLDVPLFRICLGTISILLAFLFVLPGFRGKQRIFVFFRWLPAIVIAFFIVFCNFAPFWRMGKMNIQTAYKLNDRSKINCSLGVMMGLRGVNVTLDSLTEDIDFSYNEYFSWTWLQNAQLTKDYENARLKGLPIPILWIAETLTLDHGNVRMGREYRQTGWYSHIALWTAFPLFILANILLQMVIQYGALFLIFTGLTLVIANVVAISFQSTIPFSLAFQDMNTGQTEQLLLNCSFCFDANLVNSLVCILLGIIIFFFDLRRPDLAAEFFGNDVLQSYEDYFAEPIQKYSSDTNGERNKTTTDNSGLPIIDGAENIRLRKRSNGGFLEIGGGGQETAHVRALKKRSIFGDRLSRFQKNSMKKTITIPEQDVSPPELKPRMKGPRLDKDPDSPVYANYEQTFDTIGEDPHEHEL